jgi:hypothetical protein
MRELGSAPSWRPHVGDVGEHRNRAGERLEEADGVGGPVA